MHAAVSKTRIESCICLKTGGRRATWRQRRWTIIAFLVLLVFGELLRLQKYGRDVPRFFFENATPELLAVGHPNEKQMRTDLAKLERILITDYMNWHSASISAIKEGRKLKGSVKTVIYSGAGGLGDRFRGLLHAYLRCVFTKRLLLIKWDTQYPLSKAFMSVPGKNLTYEPVYFSPRLLLNGSYDEIQVGKHNQSDSHYFSLTQTLWMRASPSVSLKHAFAFVKKYPMLSTSRELQGILPLKNVPKQAEFFPLLFRALFRPTPDLRRIMGKPTERTHDFSFFKWGREHGYMKNIRVRHAFVSVHARLGHGVNEKHERFDLQIYGHTMESVASCMSEKALEIAKDMGVDPPRFYLATDTVEFREILQNALLKRDKRTKMMYGKWDVKHVKNLRKRKAQDLEQYLHTFMDLYMLSKGVAMLQTKSGFSNLAVWMGGIRSVSMFHAKNCLA